MARELVKGSGGEVRKGSVVVLLGPDLDNDERKFETIYWCRWGY